MKQIKNLLLTTIILITFSACQDKFGEQSFVIVVEAENERLKARLDNFDEIHRKDIRAVREEYLE